VKVLVRKNKLHPGIAGDEKRHAVFAEILSLTNLSRGRFSFRWVA
jgi:hypothetical protein